MKAGTSYNNFWYNFKKYLPLLNNLAGKDFKIKYRRSALGVVWSVLNPLLTMLVLTAVFGSLFGMNRGADIGDFAVYYIVGAAIWNFFSEATSLSLTSILSSAPLIKKVYIPKYIFPLEKCLFALINFAFSLVAVALVMAIRFKNLTSFGATVLLFPIPVFYCLLFVMGMCLILSAVSVYFQDIIHLYSVILTLWMYLTPLIYPMSMIENAGSSFLKNVALPIIKYNPMTQYIQYFRDVVIYGRIPGLMQNLICFAYGISVLVIGIFVFNKLQKKFILHI